MGQRSLACRELRQDRCGGVLVQPVQHGVRAVVAGQVVVQGLQLGMNRAGVVAQELIEALPQGTACAPARAVLGALAASRAGVPERRGADAGPAERAGGRPAANRPDVAAAGAACAPLLAGVAPRLAGDLGDLGGSQARADRADHRLSRPAGRAQRTAGCPDADDAAPGAADTRFQVGGVGDQAVGTQRPSVLIAGSRLPDDPAARACYGAGPGHAVAAEPHPVAGLDQGNDPPAVRAGGADDPLRPGVGQGADQPQYRRDRCSRAGSGEQPGVILQRPRQTAALPGAGRGSMHGGHDRPGQDIGIDHGDDPGHDRSGVPIAALGLAGRATRSSRPVADADRPAEPAARAWFRSGAAGPAVPVLAAALQGAQLLAAPGADRRRDSHGTGPAQRDQQIPGHPGRRGTPVGEQRRLVQQRLSQPASLGAAGGDTPHEVTGHLPVKARLGAAQQADDHTDRVGEHIGCLRRHRLLAGAGDAGAFGAQLANTRLCAAGSLRGAGQPPGRDRLDQLAHRAVQDVQQRHQDLEAEPLRPVDDQPVDLAGGQPDPAPGQRLDQVSGGEHATAGHHLPQMPAVVKLACHQRSSLLPPAGTSSAGPIALRSAVFMKSPLTWV